MWIGTGLLLCLLWLTGPPASTSSHWRADDTIMTASGLGEVGWPMEEAQIGQPSAFSLGSAVTSRRGTWASSSISACHLLNGDTLVALVGLW